MKKATALKAVSEEKRRIEEFTHDEIDEMGLNLSGVAAISDALMSVNETDGLNPGTICALMFILREKLDRVDAILYHKDLKETES